MHDHVGGPDDDVDAVLRPSRRYKRRGPDTGKLAGKGVFFARYSVDGQLVNTKKLVIR